MPTTRNRDRALGRALQPPGWEERGSSEREAHWLEIAAYEVPTDVQTLGEALGVIVAHSTGREALPDRAGEVIQTCERACAVDRSGHLVAKGHAFPFGLEARCRDVTHVRQSSAVAGNDAFRLD